MKRVTEGCAADVVGNRIRQINSRVAKELCAQREIEVIEIGKEIFIQPATQFKNLAAIEHSGAAAAEDWHRLVVLAMVAIEMAQAIGSTGHQHRISGAVEVSALRHAQELARGEAKF